MSPINYSSLPRGFSAAGNFLCKEKPRCFGAGLGYNWSLILFGFEFAFSESVGEFIPDIHRDAGAGIGQS